MDEIKSKDRTIFALEKELESTTGVLQKLQLQKDALDEQLYLVKEAECGLGSPKREIPGRAGDGAEHCGSPVSGEDGLDRGEHPHDLILSSAIPLKKLVLVSLLFAHECASENLNY